MCIHQSVPCSYVSVQIRDSTEGHPLKTDIHLGIALPRDVLWHKQDTQCFFGWGDMSLYPFSILLGPQGQRCLSASAVRAACEAFHPFHPMPVCAKPHHFHCNRKPHSSFSLKQQDLNKPLLDSPFLYKGEIKRIKWEFLFLCKEPEIHW